MDLVSTPWVCPDHSTSGGHKTWKSGFFQAEKQLLDGNVDKGAPGAVGLLSISFSDLPCSEFDLRHPRDASERGLGGEGMEIFPLSWFIFLLRCL